MDRGLDRIKQLLNGTEKIKFKACRCYTCNSALFYIIEKQRLIDSTREWCNKCKKYQDFILFEGNYYSPMKLKNKKDVLYNLRDTLLQSPILQKNINHDILELIPVSG